VPILTLHSAAELKFEHEEKEICARPLPLTDSWTTRWLKLKRAAAVYQTSLRKSWPGSRCLLFLAVKKSPCS